MSLMMVGVLGFVGILILILFVRLPIGFSMLLAGFLGTAYLTSFDTALGVLGRQVWVSSANYDIAVVAMFVLMGELAFSTGVSDGAFNAAQKWLGKIRGGVAMATIGACSAFAAVSGSSPATAATVGGVALPKMKKLGYSDELATGSIAAGGTLGILIPPSLAFIMFGILTEQSISELYMAGIVPGLLLTLMFMLAIWVTVKIKRQETNDQSFSMREKLASLKGVIDITILFVVVIGGMFAGLFTPTEAGAAGVVAVIIVSLFKRTFSLNLLIDSMRRATVTTGMIITIFIGGMLFSYFLAASTLPFRIGDVIAGLPVSPLMIMVAMIAIWFFLGCLMDSMAMTLLTVPVFYPIIQQLGFSPIWFSVLGVMSVEAGMITPPVGINVYIIAGVAKGIPVHTIFRGILPFLAALIAAIALVLIFPDIALFLPSLLVK